MGSLSPAMAERCDYVVKIPMKFCVNVGVAGAIYMRLPERGAFQYYNDAEKTAKGRRGDYFTLGDIGYLDADDYLFLTGRSAETIIAGGVNIYPQEIEDVIVHHPKVMDVAVFGIPNEEFGEEIKAVVELHEGYEPSDELAAEITAWAGTRMGKFKLPRSIDFVDQLPREPNGKLIKRKLRDPYWEGVDRQI